MATQQDNLEWLEDWYQSQCNGDWENSRGMRLESLNDPGWRLTIHLDGTSAANSRPQQLNLDTPCGEWINCSISEDRFQGSGDPRKLEQIIGIFRHWVDATS
jgi:hypothetical protein